MKKLMLMACALLLTGAFATGAMAADVSGLYLSGKFIYGYTKMDNFSLTQSEGSKVNLGDKNDDAWGGAFAVGYDFYSNYQVPLRAELEYSIFSSVEAKKSVGATMDPGGDGVLPLKVKQKYNIQTLLLNGYWDIHNKTVCTPYLTAGIGLAFVDTKGSVNVDFQEMNLVDISSGSKLRTNLAWQVGAGVAFELTENWSFDAGYRFMGLGKAKTKALRGDIMGEYMKTGNHCKTKNLYMHQVSAGVRYTF